MLPLGQVKSSNRTEGIWHVGSLAAGGVVPDSIFHKDLPRRRGISLGLLSSVHPAPTPRPPGLVVKLLGRKHASMEALSQ